MDGFRSNWLLRKYSSSDGYNIRFRRETLNTFVKLTNAYIGEQTVFFSNRLIHKPIINLEGYIDRVENGDDDIVMDEDNRLGFHAVYDFTNDELKNLIDKGLYDGSMIFSNDFFEENSRLIVPLEMCVNDVYKLDEQICSFIKLSPDMYDSGIIHISNEALNLSLVDHLEPVISDDMNVDLATLDSEATVDLSELTNTQDDNKLENVIDFINAQKDMAQVSFIDRLFSGLSTDDVTDLSIDKAIDLQSVEDLKKSGNIDFSSSENLIRSLPSDDNPLDVFTSQVQETKDGDSILDIFAKPIEEVKEQPLTCDNEIKDENPLNVFINDLEKTEDNVIPDNIDGDNFFDVFSGRSGDMSEKAVETDSDTSLFTEKQDVNEIANIFGERSTITAIEELDNAGSVEQSRSDNLTSQINDESLKEYIRSNSLKRDDKVVAAELYHSLIDGDKEDIGGTMADNEAAEIGQ